MNTKQIFHIVLSLVIIISSIVLWAFCRKAYIRYTKNLNRNKKNIAHLVSGVFKYCFTCGVILVILQINGVNVNSAIAGLGIASTIVGLSLQDLLKDIIMGVNITSEDFFSVGDVVKYKDIEGVVVGFSARTTKIKNIGDSSVITICNRNISEISRCGGFFDVDLPLSYGESFRKIKDVMLKICDRIKGMPEISDCEYKGADSFDSSAVIYKLRVHCNLEHRHDIKRSAIGIIQEELEEASIEIPFTQIVLHQPDLVKNN